MDLDQIMEKDGTSRKKKIQKTDLKGSKQKFVIGKTIINFTFYNHQYAVSFPRSCG